MNRWRFETDRRYYEIALEKDLFGEWILTRYWGGKGSSHFGQKSQWVESFDLGLEEAEKIKKIRIKRGYRSSRN